MAAEQSFGILVKSRRRELGLTQDELARRVGCAPITVRKIEADDLRPSVQIAERLAMALNIPLEERSGFVKLARMERTPADEPQLTPMPALEEIGMEDLSGRAIRGYALGELLGSGGMGAVYRATQPLVEREVAIKIILPKYANHPDFIRRFEAEAQLVARLEHPHIVPLYDYWREPSVAYLVMRLLRGGSVQSLLQNGVALPPITVLRIVEQIGSALGAAHRAGVVHRDLKPANVLLDEDSNAYLADFGIAKNLSSFSSGTEADVIIGSPNYISPEQILSESIRPQTDIYALGVMLYELLTGAVPFRGPTPFDVMHQHLNTPLPPLSANHVGLPGSLDEIIKHATEKDPLHRYENLEDMLNDLRGSLGKGLSSNKDAPIRSQTKLVALKETDNPYKGLRSFREGDAQDFFGREALLQQLLIRLEESGELSRFLTIVGPSGSGKSSIVKAGLIPALRRGALPGSENWFIVEMMPSAHPLEELEAALLRVAVNPPASLIEQFQHDSRGLIRAVRRSLPDDPNIELVLVIDQFEEVFTLLQDENERIRFLGLLVSAALDENSRIRIVITMRADFTDRPLGYMDFGEILRQRMEIVLPLTSDEMESAIISPAERVGLGLEQGLVPTMLRDLADQPGALPLLQYALTELFEKRDMNTLTKSAYQNIGGVLGALGRRAEEVFTGLDTECQEIAKQLFLRLVTVGEGVEDTRRRALIFELENLQLGDVEDAGKYSRSFQQVLDSFGRARLLSFDRDTNTRGPTVEVAHEAILREWSRLRNWLNENRALVRMQRQLALAASEWENAQRDDSFLLTGTRLAKYEGWLENTPVALTEHELVFLRACHTARAELEAQAMAQQQHELEVADRQRRAREQLRRRIMVGLGSFSAILLVLLVFALVQLNMSRAQKLGFQAQVAFAEQNYQAAALYAYQSSQMHENAAASLVLKELPYENFSLGKGLLGHTDSVNSVAWSKDGRLASASDDFTIILWNLATHTPAQTLRGHTLWVTSIAWSTDGRLASASVDDTVILWDLSNGTPAQILRGHTSAVTSVAWSADGRLASASADKTIILWDLTTGKPAQTLHAHTDSVNSVAWSADGNLASGSFDNMVIIWDPATGKPAQTLQGHTASVTSVAWSADGRLASASADKSVVIWNLDTGAPTQTLQGHTASVTSVAWSEDGRLASASADNTVILWNLVTGTSTQTLRGHTAYIASVAWSADGDLASASADNTVILWDLTTSQPTRSLKGHTAYITSLAWSTDGRLASASADNTVILWDLSTGTPAQVLRGHTNQINSVAWSEDGDLASASADHTVILWDLTTGTPAQTLHRHTDRVNSVAWSADGRLASGSWDGTVILWDLTAGKPSQILQGHKYFVTDVAWSADGRLASVSPWQGKIILWDLDKGAPAQTLTGYFSDSFPNSSIAWSTNGLLASADKSVVIWDLDTGKPAQILRGHTNTVNSVAWSANGRLASSSDALSDTVILWDLTTRTPAQTLRGANSIAWSPDGRLTIASSDNSIRILRSDLIHSSPCEWILRNMTAAEWITYQGTLYIYKPACQKLPLPAEVIRLPYLQLITLAGISNAYLWWDPDVIFISWKGRAFVLAIVMILSTVLWGFLKFAALFWRRIRVRVRVDHVAT